MTRLRFNDGVEFETEGNLRVESRFDGFYVVGEGMLMPVASREEGEAQIAEMLAVRAQKVEETMKKNEVKVGGTYRAKVSGKVVDVTIVSESRYGGYDGLNLATGKSVRIKSAQRLRGISGREVAKLAQKKTAEAPAAPAPAAVTTVACPRCKGEKKFAGKECPTCKGAGTIAGAKKAEKTPTGAPGTSPATDAAKADHDAPQAPRDAKKRAPKVRDDGKMSGLDAAAKILAEAKDPMNAKTLVDCMIAKGLWTTGGKTPAATIYAAMLREIQKKGVESRFVKTEKGKFALAQ